jgi:hypothetical protein
MLENISNKNERVFCFTGKFEGFMVRCHVWQSENNQTKNKTT